MGTIQVNHEWGTLREAVVGIPFLKIPDTLPKAIYNYSPAEGIAFLEANLGKTLEEADPERYGQAKQQMDDVVAILESRGVTVHRAAQLDDVELGYLDNLFPASGLQFFARDPVVVIGDRFIELQPFLPIRRREAFGIRRALHDRLGSAGVEVGAVPTASPEPEAEDGSWGPGPFLEGGDIFVLGREIYVGNTGNASNHLGVEWLRRYLGDEYRVHEVALSNRFLHLDCCLATPRPGLAIVCREAFVDGLPDFLADWDLIDVPPDDAEQKLACNGLVLDERSIIIASGLDYLADALRQAGQEVIETPFDAVYQWAGAFRCWHHPLVRESNLPG